MDEIKILDGKLIAKQGDITKEDTDAVVNAANSTLYGGGGVDGAIHRAGGSRILEECREIRNKEYPNGLPTGEAVITTAGNMPSEYVIHTVGPVWHGGNNGEDELLGKCYINSLKIAVEYNCRSIAFPNISTGIYGFPVKRAIRIVLKTIKDFLSDKNNNSKLDKIVLIYFNENELILFKDIVSNYF